MDNIWMVAEVRHYRDRDGREEFDVGLLAEEGFFTDREQAEIRVAELGEDLLEDYRVKVEVLRSEHQKKVARAKAHNREAAILIANGIRKRMADDPGQFRGPSLEEYLSRRENYVTYEVEMVGPAPVKTDVAAG